jgi:hypothetical protein
MKKSLWLMAIFCVLLGAESHAQISMEGRKISSRAECERSCNKGSFTMPHYRKELDKILAAIEKEKDPEKLKELRKKEQEETERVKDKIEASCTYICEGNPE